MKKTSALLRVLKRAKKRAKKKAKKKAKKEVLEISSSVNNILNKWQRFEVNKLIRRQTTVSTLTFKGILCLIMRISI